MELAYLIIFYEHDYSHCMFWGVTGRQTIAVATEKVIPSGRQCGQKLIKVNVLNR